MEYSRIEDLLQDVDVPSEVAMGAFRAYLSAGQFYDGWVRKLNLQLDEVDRRKYQLDQMNGYIIDNKILQGGE